MDHYFAISPVNLIYFHSSSIDLVRIRDRSQIIKVQALITAKVLHESRHVESIKHI